MFDLDKIVSAAQELGYEVEINSAHPGIHYSHNGEIIQSVSYEEIRETQNGLFNKNSVNIEM